MTTLCASACVRHMEGHGDETKMCIRDRFPEEEQPGVDLILPDFNYIKDRLDKVDALVLTHGHEDHIGGVPYLLKMRPDIPLIGSKLTLGFVEAKCREHRIEPVMTQVEMCIRDSRRHATGRIPLEEG